jgi:hypothetical protein
MRYLKGTLDLKLCLGGKDVSLRGYCDADWGGDANERRSTTGYVFFVGVGYWKQLENKQEVKHSRFMKNGKVVFPNKKITKVVCFKCYNHKTMACNN